MTLSERLHTIQQQIIEGALSVGRSPQSIRLVAVSKGQSSEAIRAAFHAGIRSIGENYLQEALTKIQRLTDLPVCWHFIGQIQSNKTAQIAHHFSWVQSVSSEKIIHLLAKHRALNDTPLNICLQVNMDEEKTKSGVTPHQLTQLIPLVLAYPTLKLRGLMALPKYHEDEEQQSMRFTQMATLFHLLNTNLNLGMDTLSMGMSHDFKTAIRSGSTLIRIGQALFGKREVL